MGSEKQEPITISDYYHTPMKKLSLQVKKRPCLPVEAPTPPPRTTALSVPFKWEEAPGKPRLCHTRSDVMEKDDHVKVVTRRALELPPRLNVDSPTTVLGGPYVGRAVSFTTPYRNKEETEGNLLNFGSSRWGGLKKKENGDEGNIDFSNWSVDGSSNVKITRVRRKGSFSTLSHGKSHLWASIYGSFKQAVPWKRRQEKHGPRIDII